MTTFKIVFTPAAKAVAGETLAAAEHAARREIVFAFTEYFDLERYCSKGTAWVDTHVTVPGIERTFRAYPLDSRTWEVDLVNETKAFRFAFTPKAVAAAGEHLAGVEELARSILGEVFGESGLACYNPADGTIVDQLFWPAELPGKCFSATPLSQETWEIELVG